MEATALEQAGRLLASWNRTLILTHDRPDGDALGAIGGMNRVIRAQGRQAEALLYRPVAARYRFLSEGCGLSLWPEGQAAPGGTFDGILILDTCSWSQLEPAAAFLRSSPLPRIVVDHHATRDDMRGAGPEVTCVLDETSASACGLAYEWCRHMGWEVDTAARDAFFAGIATDTGWFRFPSVDGRTLRAAGELIDKGVRPDVMYSRLFEGHRPARLRLIREMLETLEYHADGAIAVMWLTQPMFVMSDAAPSDSEDLVNEPLMVESVVVSVLLTEMPDGLIRVNFRSRSPELTGRDVDVSALAREFGGGGHRRASGARIAGGLETARAQVVRAATTALQTAPAHPLRM